MLERDQILRSLELVRGEAREGFFALSWKGPDAVGMQTECFNVADVSAAADFAAAVAGQAHVYLGSGLLREPATGGRGSARDVSHSAIATLDVDVGSDGHKKSEPRPATKADALRLLEVIPKPSEIIDTGNGFLFAWSLDQPFTIKSEADRLEAERLQKGFQAGVRATAREQFGWVFDTTSDLARLIRVAGTQNHKSVPPKAVFFRAGHDAANLLSRETMATYALKASPVRAVARPRGEARCNSPAGEEQIVSREPEIAPIVAGCGFMEHWVDEAASLSEPAWKAGIDILARCKDARAFIHETSSRYPGLHLALPAEMSAFCHYLLNRDISAFSPDAPPPMTDAKGQIIADCKPAIERQLLEMFGGREGPFEYDLVAPAHVVAALRLAGLGTVSDDAVRRAFRKLGFRACKNVLPPLRQNDVRWAKDQRVWAVRDVARLSEASKAELKAHMLGQLGTGRTAA